MTRRTSNPYLGKIVGLDSDCHQSRLFVDELIIPLWALAILFTGVSFGYSVVGRAADVYVTIAKIGG